MLENEDDTSEWIQHETPPYSFEKRISEVMLPAMESAGLKLSPDLVVFGSLFWDERYLGAVSHGRLRF
jgi:hypothetical protein